MPYRAVGPTSLILAMILFLPGCNATNPRYNPPTQNRVETTTEKAAETVRETTQNLSVPLLVPKETLWPFSLAGGIGLIGGLGAIIFGRDYKLLIAGAIIALIPVGVYAFLPPLIIPVAIMAALTGIMLVIYVGFRVYRAIMADPDLVYDHGKMKKRERKA